MIANYHSHTWRCTHAQGTEEEYVRCAIDRGLKILGFSDHAPYYYPDRYVSRIRMRPEQLKDYADTVLALQKTYQKQIDIYLGLEIEYYPDLIPQMLPFYRDHGISYLILGQHYLYNEINAPYVGRPPTDSEEILSRYCNQVIDAIHTGLFTYLAHPDLVYFIGQPEIYRTHMRRLCREAKQAGLPLEINLAGISTQRNYPNRAFWEIAAEEGCQVVLGCDAHTPEGLREENTERQALQWVQELGLDLLQTVELKKF